MLAEPKEFKIPDYPPRPTPPYHELLMRYLKTRDFYDLPESVQFRNVYLPSGREETGVQAFGLSTATHIESNSSFKQSCPIV